MTPGVHTPRRVPRPQRGYHASPTRRGGLDLHLRRGGLLHGILARVLTVLLLVGLLHLHPLLVERGGLCIHQPACTLHVFSPDLLPLPPAVNSLPPTARMLTPASRPPPCASPHVFRGVKKGPPASEVPPQVLVAFVLFIFFVTPFPVSRYFFSFLFEKFFPCSHFTLAVTSKM